MTRQSRLMSGLILILVPTIQYGGYFLLTQLADPASGYMQNALRQNFFRAGHAHAGVIVLLSLIVQILADSTALGPATLWFVRISAPVSAMLISAGFFFSTVSPTSTHPTDAVVLVYIGALALAASVLTLAIGLIRASAHSSKDSDAPAGHL